MRNARNLTLKQKKVLQKRKLNPNNWRFIKGTSNYMEIINKSTEKIKIIKLD